MERKRQIILIMTDSTRYDMLGCYGNSDMKTPNLDRLAKEGMRFEHAYSCQPVCGPARAALFTGQYPHSCGSFTNSYALGNNVKTIGQRLQDHGIHTSFIGKYHLDGGDYFGLGRCPDGWDPEYWYDMRCYLEELTPKERMMSRVTPKDGSQVSEQFTYGHKVCNKAIQFVQANKDQDFFLVVSLDEPHDPSICPEPYASMYNHYQFPKTPNVWDKLAGKPEYQRIWAGESLQENPDFISMEWPSFFGCNSYADYEIGRVLDAINENLQNPLIIYTSDHGEAFRSHCLQGKGPAAYDEIARVPLIIRGGISDCVATHPVSHINIVPTILGYMDIPVPKILEGKSIFPMLFHPDLNINERIYLEFMRYECDHDGFGGFRPMRAVFDGRYKLSIHLLDDTDELYDMLVDPYEMVNLIGRDEFYAIAKKLHTDILSWMNRTRDPFRGYDWEYRPWRRNDEENKTWEYTGCTRQRENEEYEPRQLDYLTGLEMKCATRKRHPE